MRHFLFFLSVLSTASFAYGSRHWRRWDPIPRKTLMTFECPQGPGYLRMTLVDPWQNRQTKTWYLGTPENCETQRQLLSKTRSEITELKVFAVCSNGQSYMNKYSVDQWGRLTFAGQTYYGDLSRCLENAATINR